MTEYSILKIGETFAVAADGHAIISFQTIEPAAVLVSQVLQEQHSLEGAVEESPPPED